MSGCFWYLSTRKQSQLLTKSAQSFFSKKARLVTLCCGSLQTRTRKFFVRASTGARPASRLPLAAIQVSCLTSQLTETSLLFQGREAYLVSGFYPHFTQILTHDSLKSRFCTSSPTLQSPYNVANVIDWTIVEFAYIRSADEHSAYGPTPKQRLAPPSA